MEFLMTNLDQLITLILSIVVGFILITGKQLYDKHISIKLTKEQEELMQMIARTVWSLISQMYMHMDGPAKVDLAVKELDERLKALGLNIDSEDLRRVIINAYQDFQQKQEEIEAMRLLAGALNKE